MRFLFLVLSFAILIILKLNAQNAKPGQFILTGKLTGRDTGKITLRYFDKFHVLKRDTAIIKNGCFQFSGLIAEPTAAQITDNLKVQFLDVNDINVNEIFLEPRLMRITLIENKFKEAKVTGSKTQTEIDLLTQKKQHVYKLIDSSNLVYRKLKLFRSDSSSTRPTDLESHITQIKRSFDLYMNELKNIDYNFIIKNPNSFYSSNLLAQYFYSGELPVDSVKLFRNRLSPIVRDGFVASDMTDAIKIKENSAVHKTAPLFNRADNNGKEIILSSFRNDKYILLDFWASWCVPCRDFNPKLKALYNKYHNKGLEIISISLDQNETSWKDAIKNDSIENWYQILSYKDKFEPLGKESEDNLKKKYSVQAIPQMVLIDKEGLIIGRYFGERDINGESELYESLNDIFR
jgi:thiol-disulfide isomerase/thioredoxin